MVASSADPMSFAAGEHDEPAGGPPAVPVLDLSLDVCALTAALCDIASVSGAEGPLTDAVEAFLAPAEHLSVTRHGNVVVARTNLGKDQRVILAGHLDTVPLTEPANLPTRLVEGQLWGRGTVDMKGGVAVQLRLALDLVDPICDLTFIFYDNEEVDAHLNGLGHLVRDHPELVAGDFAVLLEPTGAAVEGGCKGTLRFELVTRGVAAHSGRPWMGDNAIHKMAAVLDVLAAHEARVVEVDGLTYHEGLSAVGIAGGAGNNVIPDECHLLVNYRFAPDLSESQAVEYVREVFPGYELIVRDLAGGARPGLQTPVAQSFMAAVGGQVRAKEGWTDVARFAQLGIPAVNYGPGDPLLAHKDDERAPVSHYVDVEQGLRRWLSHP